MIDSLDCLPCLSRQATITARLSTDNAAQQQAGLGEAFMHLAMMEPSTPPLQAAEDVQRTLLRHTGSADPYANVRRSLTVAARALLPALLRSVNHAEDPLAAALLISVAGNLLEDAREPALAGRAMDEAWHATARGVLAINHTEALRAAASRAKTILFLADNAGEVIWDRLLIEKLGAARVTLVVRNQPYLHDALTEDLDFRHCPVAPRVLATDDLALNTPHHHDDDTLSRLLPHADLVIAKGSSWHERLAGRVPPEKRFHLLAASCPRVAACFGVAPKALVAAHAAELPPSAKNLNHQKHP